MIRKKKKREKSRERMSELFMCDAYENISWYVQAFKNQNLKF